MRKETLIKFYRSVENELDNILSFWLENTIDRKYEGFYGEITNDLKIKHNANKGLILNTRILWTFATAYRLYGDISYLEISKRAFDYLIKYFWDQKYSGVYWMLNYKGQPFDTKKKIYGQAFAIYGLSEFYRATGEEEALNKAKILYRLIEKNSHDLKNKGYIEGFNRDWSPAVNMRLSDESQSEKKSMNTLLHLLEAYTNLYRVWKNNELETKLRELIEIFIQYIIDPETYHFRLFFNENWKVKSEKISYGHDIEGSWLLVEAAVLLGNKELITQVKEKAVKMAEVTLQEGLASDGSLFNEGTSKSVIDFNRYWWVQAETVVGFLNTYQLTKREEFLQAALKCWEYIENFIIDRKYGEWFWLVDNKGRPSYEIPKVNAWKGPYHNSRTCFEVLNRLNDILFSGNGGGQGDYGLS